MPPSATPDSLNAQEADLIVGILLSVIVSGPANDSKAEGKYLRSLKTLTRKLARIAR